MLQAKNKNIYIVMIKWSLECAVTKKEKLYSYNSELRLQKGP